MGDHYQIAADLDADVKTAALTASQLRSWLIGQEIIVGTPSNCVLGETLGHAPGKNYAYAVEEPDPFLLELRTNGVAFIAKRSVYSSDGVAELTLICPTCRQRFDWSRAWQTALQEWHKNAGSGILSCERCGTGTSVAAWEHEPPSVFGHFGIEFWNWPQLRPDFLARIAEVTKHRFRLVFGKR
jgi:hypothetical protein